MDNSRMSTADMLQYCEEALAWEDFGPIDIFFFESVKKILLGQCSATEEPEEVIDDLMGIERPVRDVELEPEYDKYADIYYGEEGDDDIPDYSRSKEDEAFDSVLSGNGGFFGAKAAEADTSAHSGDAAPAEEAYTLGGESTFTEGSGSAYTFSEDAATVSTDGSAYTLNDSTAEAAAETAAAEESPVIAAPANASAINISNISPDVIKMAGPEFDGLKESIEAAAAEVEKAINNK